MAALGCEDPLANFSKAHKQPAVACASRIYVDRSLVITVHGSYPKGVGWYRRTFDFAAGSSGDERVAWLHFEGILNDAMVFVNGKFLSRKFQSYSGFSVDLPAELLKPTGNVLAVRAGCVSITPSAVACDL